MADPNEKHPTNRLASATSPYLLQHATNPVDWWPWCDEAIARAREEDKSILLSIGYASCHWCHVMERESFEDEKTAALLNANFIPIKVDREERPDLDDIYMMAVQMLTGQGGWPLNVFLTPDLEPFFGGTYFPPFDYRGMPAFRTVLTRVAELWQSERQSLLENAEALAKGIRKHAEGGDTGGVLTPNLLSIAIEQFGRAYDEEWGGFGGAPKFPPSGAVALLLRHHARTDEKRWLDMAVATLDRMAQGGMHDQVGGGFHRYSVDEKWLVPHFEKMLYDNALLARAYLEAWQRTGEKRHARVVRRTLDYLMRDMTDACGALHASEDADSEGGEGLFYTWTPNEACEVLGVDAAELMKVYGITEDGNFEGRSILNETKPVADETRPRFDPLLEQLREAREARERPARDDKIIAAWNGLALDAFARAGLAFAHTPYINAARGIAAFVSKTLWQDETLHRTWRAGVLGPAGFLEDYAEVASGFVTLFEVTGEACWLETAKDITQTMLDRFGNGHGLMFSAQDGTRDLLTRTCPTFDGATPSGNAAAARVLWRLGRLTDQKTWQEHATSIVETLHQSLATQPLAHTHLLLVADQMLCPGPEVVISGAQTPEGMEMLSEFGKRFLPNACLVHAEAAVDPPLPLQQGRVSAEKTTAWICQGQRCLEPAHDLDTFRGHLEEVLGNLRQNT